MAAAFRHVGLLHALIKVTDRTRRALLPHLNEEAHMALCECVTNVFSDSHLDSAEKSGLRGLLADRKEQLLLLTSDRVPVEQKRQILCDVSDELGVIIAVALPMLVALSM